METRPSADHGIDAENADVTAAAVTIEMPRGGFMRPQTHWLSARMSAAAVPAPHVAEPTVELPAEVPAPHVDPAEVDTERTAAIETLVALAAKIEAARNAGSTTPGESAFGAPPAVASTTPSFVYDPRAALGTAPAVEPPVVEDEYVDEPPIPYDPASRNEKPRWFDVLRSPESGLVLVAISLIAVWAYTSAPPRTAEPSVPRPSIARITPGEAATPAPADTERLSFLGDDGCAGTPCGGLLASLGTPGADQEAVAAYAPAAGPDTPDAASIEAGPSASIEPAGTPEAPVARETSPDTTPAQAAEPQAIAVEPLAAGPLAATEFAPSPLPAEQIPAAPAEPDLAHAPASSPAATDAQLPVPIEPSPTVGAAMQVVPADMTALEAPAPPHVVGTPPPQMEVPSAKRQAALNPVPNSQAVASPRKLEKKAAKKASAPATAKSVGPKPPSTKAAAKKPSPLKQAPVKQAANQDAAGKAPGFPTSAPPTALFKPAPAQPLPAAIASKPATALAPEPAPAVGDKPPGFEILTNFGGGFFAMQPY